MSSDAGQCGTHFSAICDRCREIRFFSTVEAKRFWIHNHPHDEDSDG